MALYYYDKCLASICENFPVSTTYVVNDSAYDYVYCGQSSDFTGSTYAWCDCIITCNITCLCCETIVNPIIDGRHNYYRNGSRGGRNIWYIDNKTPINYYTWTDGSNQTECSCSMFCGTLKFGSLYTGSLSDGCILNLNYCDYGFTCGTPGTSGPCGNICFCSCIDSSLLYNVYCTCGMPCGQALSFSVTCDFCIEVKKLAGVDCYEICLNGVSCFCKPLCSFDKWCVMICSDARTSGTEEAHSCIKKDFYCMTTDDTNVCVFNNITGVYIYYKTSLETTSQCADTCFGIDTAFKYDNGEVGYGKPAYISDSYDRAINNTWSVECTGDLNTSKIVMPSCKYPLVAIYVPLYCCNNCIHCYYTCDCLTSGDNCWKVAGTGAYATSTQEVKNAFWIYCTV